MTLHVQTKALLDLLAMRAEPALETMTPDGYKASLSVSLSDESPYALAFIVISAVSAEWTKP